MNRKEVIDAVNWQYRFGPASSHEKIVFGAQRPNYPQSSHIILADVSDWVCYVKQKEIQRICCLLSIEQLGYYEFGLIDYYRKCFGAENVCHAPIDDYCLASQELLKSTILPFLTLSDLQRLPTLVHCSGGSGRTGHVLAAWLVYGRNYEPLEAIEEVKKQGRNPLEAVECGNVSRKQLLSLLESVKSTSPTISSQSQ